MRLPLLPEALDELHSEMIYLESERPGWGKKLLEAVTCYQDTETGEVFFMGVETAAISRNSDLARCSEEVEAMYGFCASM